MHPQDAVLGNFSYFKHTIWFGGIKCYRYLLIFLQLHLKINAENLHSIVQTKKDLNLLEWEWKLKRWITINGKCLHGKCRLYRLQLVSSSWLCFLFKVWLNYETEIKI